MSEIKLRMVQREPNIIELMVEMPKYEKRSKTPKKSFGYSEAYEYVLEQSKKIDLQCTENPGVLKNGMKGRFVFVCTNHDHIIEKYSKKHEKVVENVFESATIEPKPTKYKRKVKRNATRAASEVN